MQEFINFDWMNYLNYYSELRKSGINTKVKAWNHWLLIGKKEGLSELLPLIISYFSRAYKILFYLLIHF
jgi:hypothetical protein